MKYGTITIIILKDKIYSSTIQTNMTDLTLEDVYKRLQHGLGITCIDDLCKFTEVSSDTDYNVTDEQMKNIKRGHCVCGQAIEKHYYIKNTETEEEHVIGSTCIRSIRSDHKIYRQCQDCKEQFVKHGIHDSCKDCRKKLKLTIKINNSKLKKFNRERITFGKYKGKTYEWLIDKSPSYLLYLAAWKGKPKFVKDMLKTIRQIYKITEQQKYNEIRLFMHKMKSDNLVAKLNSYKDSPTHKLIMKPLPNITNTLCTRAEIGSKYKKWYVPKHPLK